MKKDIFEEIGGERVAEGLYDLFKKNAWLIEAGIMKPEDNEAEAEAVIFLLKLTSDVPVKGWGNTNMAARRVANTLLMDLMSKIIVPGGPLSMGVWRVSSNTPPWRQALEVIKLEIERSHSGITRPH